MLLLGVLERVSGTTTLNVDSKLLWNESPTTYRKGQQVKISASPAEQVWYDWYIEATAAGYSNYFHVPTRFSGANLFALICCTGRDLTACSNIGVDGVHEFAVDAPLSCFANDNEYMYWNNRGYLTVTLTTP